MTRGPLKVFYSYAHADASYLTELRKHLAPLRHEQILIDWYDRKITAGTDWNQEIEARLESADIVLVLVSADLISSPYAYGKEVRRALDLHERGALKLVPVIARNCAWQQLPMGNLQALPESGRPIRKWEDPDGAYVSIVQGVEKLARELLTPGTSLIDDWLASRLLRRRVIREVQQHLTDLGFYDGPLDGIPGPLTEDAVRRFQEHAGITVDLKIGPDVIRHLERAVGYGAAGSGI